MDSQLHRLLILRQALKLEVIGMKRHGRSVYSIVKEEFGFRGNKRSVFSQFDNYVTEKKREYQEANSPSADLISIG